MIIIIVWIIILFLYSMFLLSKFFLFSCKLKKEEKISDEFLKENKRIFIAIPCLREQNCIKKTVDYFRRITDLPIVLITTEKENFEYNYDKKIVTTNQIIKNEILNSYENIFLIHYPYTSGYMADQLNYMLDHLKDIKEFDSTLDWYMALYNADSRPSKKTFQDVIKNINDGKKIMQQYSYCMKNYNKLNFILKGFALYQSNFEIKVGLYNSFLNLNYLYTYVVGHGLIINLSLLKELGNFNTTFWCEDIYLTMTLRFKNIKIKPILQLENIENADTLTKVVKQNSVWFNTTRKYGKIYIDNKKHLSASFSGLLGCLNEFRCAVNWLCFPILLMAISILSIINQNIIINGLVLLTYCMYIYINYFITIKTINMFETKKYKLNLKDYLSLFISTIISNLGPIYSMIHKTDIKYKTER